MKMFKKIMAVALVGVMALSMLTGCALSDAMKAKTVEDALSANSGITYKNDLKVKGTPWTEAGKEETTEAVTYEKDNKTYAVVVKAEPEKNEKKVSAWKDIATDIHAQLTAAGVEVKGTSNPVCHVNIDFKTVDGKDGADDVTYVIVVGKVADAE